MVRCKKREGLIRARYIGAEHATLETMIFLDSHSEANYNWIPPLLEPIALNWKTVVCPFVDVIDCDTFEYRSQYCFAVAGRYKAIYETPSTFAEVAQPVLHA